MKFNIKKFQENKNHRDEYLFELEDGTEVFQLAFETGYSEVTTPPDSLALQIYKEYDIEGHLIMFVRRWPNSFVSELKSFNKEGKLLRKEEHDSSYPISFKEVVDIISDYNIKIKDKNTTIAREVTSTGPIWYVDWKKDWGRRETLTIDGRTGKILEESHYEHEDN